MLATNDQLPVARRPRGAFFVLTALVALALTGCGGARARSPEAARADRASLPGGIPPADFRTAALNSRILSQASPAGTEEDLPVGPGDLIQVSVFEVKELSDIKVRVPLRGAITLPLLGAIPAAGRTAVQLEQDIRGRLQEKYMHDPQVSVFVVEPKSQRISVIGAVRRGGIYPMTSRLRLADALALAEGLSDDADHVIYLVRRVPAVPPGTVAMVEAGQELLVPPPTEAASAADAAANATEAVMAAIDLDALVAGRDELNVPLQAGDVINVPRAGSYYVGGEVERQGSFFLKAKTTVEQAITVAGGVKKVADWDDIRIYRAKPDGQREILTASLARIEKGAPAPELQKNDVVVVGKSHTKAFLYGAANFLKGVFGFSVGASKGL